MVNSTRLRGWPPRSPRWFDALLPFWTAGGFSSCDIWQAPILPIVDFNGDGKVDLADMTLLEANWARTSLCATSAPSLGRWRGGREGPDGPDAVADDARPTCLRRAPSVVLSWITPSFAESFDVYLGTSQSAVTNADRADPCGVLVSQGQMGTTYDPNGLLEYEQTYYWRVDLVTSGPAPTIYKGPVLSFTTEPYAVSDQAHHGHGLQLSNALTGPEKTIDGSGLDALDQHSHVQRRTMWLSKKTQTPVWIQYEFDRSTACTRCGCGTRTR